MPLQALAEEGALLLGERLRSAQERAQVVEVVASKVGIKVRGWAAALVGMSKG